MPHCQCSGLGLCLSSQAASITALLGPEGPPAATTPLRPAQDPQQPHFTGGTWVWNSSRAQAAESGR